MVRKMDKAEMRARWGVFLKTWALPVGGSVLLVIGVISLLYWLFDPPWFVSILVLILWAGFLIPFVKKRELELRRYLYPKAYSDSKDEEEIEREEIEIGPPIETVVSGAFKITKRSYGEHAFVFDIETIPGLPVIDEESAEKYLNFASTPEGREEFKRIIRDINANNQASIKMPE